MIIRLLGERRAAAVTSRVERPDAVGVVIIMAAIAGIGWIVPPFWVAVAVALELAIGGVGAVYLIGPVRAQLGFARYVTLATAGVSLALFGRVLPTSIGLLLLPVAALLLWAVLIVELRFLRAAAARWFLDLLLTVIFFAGSVGIVHLFGRASWPLPLPLMAALAFVLALRGAEASGASGAPAVGRALLHVLAVAQLGAALALLDLPGVVDSAILALTFYVWGGVAGALLGGSTARSVAGEFGGLAILGLLVALLLHRG